MDVPPNAALAALMPHLADLPARLGALLPRITRAASSQAPALAELQQRVQAQHAAMWQRATHNSPPGPDQARASNPWSDIPYFNLLRQMHALRQQWMTQFVDLLELEAKDKTRLRFIVQQWTDALAPANFAATNPEVIRKALRTQGQSLTTGQANLQRDMARGRLRMCDESAFVVGRNLATTAGAVVFENDLIQLIQYEPRRAKVHRTPLLMVPPFINKYYILDLSPGNSFVQYALDEGFQVFMISWRNIAGELGHLRWDDYATLGVQAAIDNALKVARAKSLHALGFCVGGTLLASALASCVAAERVASMTLLASLLDFRDAGDIGVYIDEAYVARTESLYADGGVVPGGQLASAFASLRARDLIWKFVIENYLLGTTPAPFDLLYWNSDSANLPGPLFAWYLRNCYLENKLEHPQALAINGQSVEISKLTMPSFVLGTELDHIVPWRSAFASCSLLGGDVEFVLGSSGHIAGVVSPPGDTRRNYRIANGKFSSAKHWFEGSQTRTGSWWPYWIEWLKAKSSAQKAAPKTLGTRTLPSIEPAPGRYVSER